MNFAVDFVLFLEYLELLRECLVEKDELQSDQDINLGKGRMQLIFIFNAKMFEIFLSCDINGGKFLFEQESFFS